MQILQALFLLLSLPNTITLSGPKTQNWLSATCQLSAEFQPPGRFAGVYNKWDSFAHYLGQMILFIKNMVCNRCITAVSQAFEHAAMKPLSVKLGEVVLAKAPTPLQRNKVASALHMLGFEILDDQKQRLIEKVKNLLREKIQTGQVEERFRISDYLAKKLHKEYSGISRLFSDVEGITIEQYFILQKIEKVKELLVYGELSLSEISYNLGYSSTAHLSAQFKKTTGLTTGHFKKLGALHRHSLDQVKRK